MSFLVNTIKENEKNGNRNFLSKESDDTDEIFDEIEGVNNNHKPYIPQPRNSVTLE